MDPHANTPVAPFASAAVAAAVAASDQMLRQGDLPPDAVLQKLGVPENTATTPAPAAPVGTQIVTLPSGKVATIRKGKGKDLVTAQRVAKSAEQTSFGLMAALVKIDGEPLPMEEFLEMDLPDVLKLQELLLGNSPTPGSST